MKPHPLLASLVAEASAGPLLDHHAHKKLFQRPAGAKKNKAEDGSSEDEFVPGEDCTDPTDKVGENLENADEGEKAVGEKAVSGKEMAAGAQDSGNPGEQELPELQNKLENKSDVMQASKSG